MIKDQVHEQIFRISGERWDEKLQLASKQQFFIGLLNEWDSSLNLKQAYTPCNACRYRMYSSDPIVFSFFVHRWSRYYVWHSISDSKFPQWTPLSWAFCMSSNLFWRPQIVKKIIFLFLSWFSIDFPDSVSSVIFYIIRYPSVFRFSFYKALMITHHFGAGSSESPNYFLWSRRHSPNSHVLVRHEQHIFRNYYAR